MGIVPIGGRILTGVGIGGGIGRIRLRLSDIMVVDMGAENGSGDRALSYPC